MFMLISTHQKVLEGIHLNYEIQIDALKAQIAMLKRNALHNKSKPIIRKMSPPNCLRDVEFNRLVALEQASYCNNGSNDALVVAL